MSPFCTEMRRTYGAQRGVSQGAQITLVSMSGGYEARFECATKVSLVAGDRDLQDYGSEREPIPVYRIATEDVCRMLGKLTETFSVALVDTVTDDKGTRFVLLWRIAARTPEEVATTELVDANQGSLPLGGGLDLDEY